jgi:hypothetical protein
MLAAWHDCFDRQQNGMHGASCMSNACMHVKQRITTLFAERLPAIHSKLFVLLCSGTQNLVSSQPIAAVNLLN